VDIFVTFIKSLASKTALLRPWLNNTEIYFHPFISTQNYTIAG
jgi:hypothetical protein